MAKRIISKLTIFLLLNLSVWLMVMPSHASATKKQVLILNSYDQGRSWTENVMHGMLSVLNNSGMHLEIHVEYMDTKRYPPSESFPYLENMYRQKYRQTAFDVILLSDNNALTFLLSRRDTLFPGVPIVFCGINNFSKELLGGQTDLTGITEDIDIKGTIALASRILPKIQKVVVINDRTPTGQANRKKFEQVAPDLPVSFELWDDITATDLQERLKGLPPDSAVLVFTFHRDKDGQWFSIPEYWTLIRESCRVPIFSLWDNDLGHGVLGGVMVYGREQGRLCAEYAIRILKGEPADSLPIILDSPNLPVLDYRLLKKFNIPKANIPAEAVVLFEPESLFHKYRNEIIASGILFALLIVLVIGLSVNILIRRRTERALIKSEALLGATQELAEVGGWEWDVEKDTMFWTDEVYRIHGFDPENIPPGSTEHVKRSLECYDPEDRPVIMAAFERCAKEGQEYDLEFPFTRQNGQRLWIRTTARSVISDGRIIKVIGTIMDITKQKQTVEALRESEKRLIEAQHIAKMGDFTWDVETGEVTWSDELFDLLQYDKSEKIDYARVNEEIHHPDDLKRVTQWLNYCIASGKAELTPNEYRLIRKDGKILYVHTVGVIEREEGKSTKVFATLQDVTERKQAEEALHVERERFFKAFRANPDPMTISRMADGTIIEVNEIWEEVLGYSRAESVGTSSISLGIWDDPTKRQKAIQQLQETSSLRNFEIDLRCKTGEVRHVILSGECLKIGGEQCLITILHDITERKRAEEALRESEERHRTILQTAMDGFWLVDLDGRLMQVNETYCQMSGYSEPELLAMHILDLEASETPDEIAAHIQKTMAQGEERFETRHCRKDGSIFDVEISIQYRPTEGGRFVAFLRDITDRKQAEEALRESEKLHKEAQRVAHIGHWELSPEIGTPVWSDEIFRIFGLNPQEREPSFTDHEAHLHPDDWPSLNKAVTLASAEGTPFDITFRLVRPDSEIKWMHAIGTTTKDEKGKVTKLFGTAQDITERKRAEEEKERLQYQLQQSQKMEAVGTLAGGIAHDFNNILAIILGNAELASADVPDSNPASESLKEIHRASVRAKDMIQRLLAFSRKTDEESTLIDMTPIIKESMKMLRSAIPTSVEFKQHISNDPCNVMGDAAQINQIVMNLVTNAADAMSKEGGLLEVTLENIILQEEKPCFDWVLSPGAYVRLRMRDTGEGIEPKIMDRIFEPYYTSKEVGKGTGMGLSVVHGIVKRHGGGIRVESEFGKGTLFEIYFPALEETAEEEKEPEGEIKGGSERILFVDDEASLANLNHQRLERLGYDVRSTTKPLEALEWFKADPDRFDVIITDMTMPRMTGDRLAAEILKIRPHMPVIICTGYSERMSAKKAEALGVRKYIEKPIDLRNLASALREVLDEK